MTGLRIGETLTVVSGGRTAHITRTARPYACDLADAYNQSMPPELAEIQHWIVGKGGNLSLEYRQDYIEKQKAAAKRRTEAEQRHVQDNPDLF